MILMTFTPICTNTQKIHQHPPNVNSLGISIGDRRPPGRLTDLGNEATLDWKA